MAFSISMRMDVGSSPTYGDFFFSHDFSSLISLIYDLFYSEAVTGFSSFSYKESCRLQRALTLCLVLGLHQMSFM